MITVADTVTLYDHRFPLLLQSGEVIGPLKVAYETYGTLNRSGTNAILVCHALTANAHAAGPGGWWDGLIGPGKALDTSRYQVICPNILGSCYGTTGPSSPAPSGRPYRGSFPDIGIRDMVRVQKRLLDHLGVSRLVTVLGSSLGGMQALEWPILYPDVCRSAIPISTAARQPAWCIALNAAARAAITADPQWVDGNYRRQPVRGLSIARMIGMISYRSPAEFEQRFGRDRRSNGLFEAESYLAHQGKKLVDRFDANTYLTLSRATDTHDVTAGRGTLEDVLGGIRCPVLSIGVSTDVRYPSALQEEIARLVRFGRYAEIKSIHGHDAFLIEFKALNRLIGEFLGSVMDSLATCSVALSQEEES